MIAAQFKQARKHLGLSQAGLASAMQCDKRTIGRWENGEREIPGPVEVLLYLMLRDRT